MVGIIIAGILLLVGPDYIGQYYSQSNKSCGVIAIIVPHYNGAGQKRDELLNIISRECQPKTIVLVSPNHYGAGESNIITSDKVWNFYANNAPPDYRVIHNLYTRAGVDIDHNAFLNEHGIKNILPELARYFPESRFVPIMIRQKTNRSETEKLYWILEKTCRNCLIIASVDFSHEVSQGVAQEQDAQTISALQNIDTEALRNTISDSPQSLYIVVQWALARNGEFIKYYNSNSGRDANSSVKDLVSYILGYYMR